MRAHGWVESKNDVESKAEPETDLGHREQSSK